MEQSAGWDAAACLTLLKKGIPYILVPALALRGYATLSLHGATWVSRAEQYGVWAFHSSVQTLYHLKEAALNEPESNSNIAVMTGFDRPLLRFEVMDAFATMLPQWEHHHVLWVMMWLWFTWVTVQRSLHVHSCQLGAVASIVVGGLTVILDLHPATALILQAFTSVLAAVPANIVMQHNDSFDLSLLCVEVIWDTSEGWISLCSIACALIIGADPLRFVLAVHGAVLLSKACESQRRGHEVDGFYPYVGVTRLEDADDVFFVLRSILATIGLTVVLTIISEYLSLPAISMEDILPGFVVHSVHSVLGYVVWQLVLLWVQCFFLAVLFDTVAGACSDKPNKFTLPNPKKRRAK